MIEISQDSTEKVEKSLNQGVVHELLEGYIGRRIRLKHLREGSYSGLQIDTTTGELQSVTVVECFDVSDEGEVDESGFDDLCISIAGQEEVEIDFDEEQLQVEVFQQDSGRWVLIYRSKHWKKMLKNGYLG